MVLLWNFNDKEDKNMDEFLDCLIEKYFIKNNEWNFNIKNNMNFII